MSVFVKSGGGENVTPEVQAQSPLVTEILESLVGKVTLANATPEAILEGYSAYVGQMLIEGKLKKGVDLFTATGCTKASVSEVTFASIAAGADFLHDLGENPKFAMVLCDATSPSKYEVNTFLYSGGWRTSNGVHVPNSTSHVDSNGNVTSVSNISIISSSRSVSFRNTTYKFAAGVKYTIVAMA